MEFRTTIPIPPREPKIGYDSAILLLGSCFVENIGRKLEYFKFPSLQNPFGILFHPAAIASFLKRVRDQEMFTEEEVFFHNERWHCFEAHSVLSNPRKDMLLKDLNLRLVDTAEFLGQASHVILTLGTAWGYKHLGTGRTVANCHKIPQKEFTKELMEVNADVESCVDLLREISPKATIIFTISPVRHLKDGFIENQQSKARLVTAVHKVKNSRENIHYFPSYEIMMDELRDYRFYGEDMIHPNQVAIDYIWKRFSETYFSPKTAKVMEEVGQIQRGLAHRPFNERSEAHRKFLESLQQKMENLQKEYPSIRF